MTIEDLLPRLQAVRRTLRGYLAQCPAHDDRTPSLSIAEGDRGLLLRCWAGCSIAEICQAIGVAQKELFYDSHPNHRAIRAAKAQRQRKTQRDEVDGFTIDALREADYFVRSRQRLDISLWTDERLDNELDALAEAHALQWAEELASWT